MLKNPKISEINRKYIWPVVLGAVGGLAASYLAGKAGDERATTAWNREKSASAKSFDRSYGAYKTRYQDTTADMRAAGLNPIMAASGGFNVGQSVTYPKANVPMAPTPLYEPASSAKDWTAARVNVEQEKKTEMEIRKVRAEANKAIAETYVARAKKGLITKQERETVKKILVLEQEIWLKRALFQRTVKESYKVVSERKMIIQKTRMLKAAIVKLQRTADVYKGPLGAILAYINALVSSTHMGAGTALQMVK